MLETIQERLVAVMSIFSLLLTAVYFFLKVDLRQDKSPVILWNIGVGLLSVIAMVYNIGCVLRGGCSVWAWFLTLMVGISTVLSIISFSVLQEAEMKDSVVQTVKIVQDNGGMY
jgi:hypothetical protein